MSKAHTVPHTKDGTLIQLGGIVWVVNPDTTYFGPDPVFQVEVLSLSLGASFREYLGDVTVCGDTWEGGNLECYSTHLEALNIYVISNPNPDGPSPRQPALAPTAAELRHPQRRNLPSAKTTMTTNPTTAEAVRAANQLLLDWEIERYEANAEGPIAGYAGRFMSAKPEQLARIIDEQTALPELKADKERLDWLEKQFNPRLYYRFGSWGFIAGEGTVLTVGMGKTLREAIDAARLAPPPSVPALPGREETKL